MLAVLDLQRLELDMPADTDELGKSDGSMNDCHADSALSGGGCY